MAAVVVVVPRVVVLPERRGTVGEGIRKVTGNGAAVEVKVTTGEVCFVIIFFRFCYSHVTRSSRG